MFPSSSQGLANELIETIPEYFYEVGASSTGKYHPDYSLGDGGLMRHTIALVRIMNHIFEVNTDFTEREKDLLRIAGMMHDTRKSGNQTEYLVNKYTRHEHPLLAAEVVRNFKDKKWDNEEIELIANAIESHMGQWNTSPRSNIVLPLPDNKYQNILHMCDYLASRKDIIIQFDKSFFGEPIEIEPATIMPFGKYKGEYIDSIPIDYIEWMLNNMDNLSPDIEVAFKKRIDE